MLEGRALGRVGQAGLQEADLGGHEVTIHALATPGTKTIGISRPPLEEAGDDRVEPVEGWLDRRHGGGRQDGQGW